MRNVFTIVLLGLFALSGMACSADSSGAKASKKNEVTRVAAKKTEVKADSVRAENVKLPKLVNLGDNKCIPCKMMVLILDELKRDYSEKLEVVFIDVWKNTEESRKYRIRVMPTQIFFDPDGKEIYRHEGFFSKEEILRKWKELGYEMTK